MASSPAAVSYLRDPIYGLLELSPGETELLSIPLLTRLKGIRQMGFAWAIFPGANHTRFEHSVGVMHAAGLMVRDLPGFDERTRELVRLAGLLHDVGHPPFSHTLELAARLYGTRSRARELSALASHEKVTERRVRSDPELRRVLERHKEFKDIEPNELALLAVGKHPDASLTRLIHGEIDADRIDYIIRDNHHCGFPSGLDVHLIPSLFLKTRAGEIVLNQDRAYFAEQLLLARHHLQVKIHDEARDRLADLLMARAVRAFFRGADPRARRAFAQIAEEAGDAELLALLRARVPKETRELEEHLAGRPPWRRLAQTSFSEISPPARYAVSLLLSESHRDLTHVLAERLAHWTGTDVVLDLWGATPPGGSLRTAEPDEASPPVPLTSLPLIRGTVQATHRAMGVRLYVPLAGPPPRLRLEEAHARYRARVDPVFELARAQRVHGRLRGEEKDVYLVTLELESALMETLKSAHRERAFAPDALLLLLHAMFEVFAAPPMHEVRVYLEGARGFEPLARACDFVEAWKQGLHAPFPYVLPVQEKDPDGKGSPVDPELEADLDRLEAFGLVVRLPREERRGRLFTTRDRYALTGWGRGLVTHLLLEDPRLARIYQRTRERLTRLVREHEEGFRGFFELVGRPDTAARQERRGRREELPLPVSR